MLWIKAFHIIFVICWFAGLFYLPRLFVYHAACQDTISNERFKIMERRLYYGITTPSGILATLFGIALLVLNYHYYLTAGWMHAKLLLIILVWTYHLMCGHYLQAFKKDCNTHSETFYRWFNEMSIFLLIGIVILVVVKPF